MKRNSGQIFPFSVMVIAILLVLILSNFEIGFSNLRKIQHQKHLDGIAMHYATDYARSLNALAALNEALVTARNRGLIVAGTYTVLAGCTYFGGRCATQFASLSLQLPSFYRNLDRLGKELVQEQEQIIRWMLQTRCQSKTELALTYRDYYFYPNLNCTLTSDYRGLPFYRPNEEFTKDIQGVEDCKVKKFNSHNDFIEFAKSKSQNLSDSSRYEAIYESNGKNTRHERPASAAIAQNLTYTIYKPVKNRMETFHFKEGSVTTCQKFTQLFGKIKGIPFIAEIPSPLVFKPEFLQRDNKILFLASTSIKSDFKKPLETFYALDDSIKPDVKNKLWATSEVLIDGTNFQKMEFKPRLSPVTMYSNLYIEAIRNKPSAIWPFLGDRIDEIAH